MSNETKHGVVFDIQRFCIGDGPGIRTTVFFKGCNLRCSWCHNPESHLVVPELFYFPALCIGCGACIDACPNKAHSLTDGILAIDRSKCDRCGNCSKVCLSKALKMLGKTMDVKAVMEEVVRDRALYQFSGGGLTISGGEPMLQMEFLEALLRAAKEQQIHTAIETAGCVIYEKFLQLGDLPDIYLFDFKGFDETQHKTNTGQSNELIMENLRRLAEWKKLIIRLPLICGANDDITQMRRTAEFISSLSNVEQVELLPYHSFGENKYVALGKSHKPFNPPTQEHLQLLKEALGNSLHVIVRGGAST